MNQRKGNKQRGTDSGKAVTKPSREAGEVKNESQDNITTDPIIAEKDEVKNAEERQRLKKDELKDEDEN